MPANVVFALVGIIVGVVLGYLLNRYLIKDRGVRAAEEAERLVRDAEKQAETLKKEALLEAKDQIFRQKQEEDAEAKERRKEIQVLESRLVRAGSFDRPPSRVSRQPRASALVCSGADTEAREGPRRDDRTGATPP